MRLAFEAARRRDFVGFFRAVDLAGGLSRWDARTLAWVAIPYYDAGRTAEAAELIAAALEKKPNDALVKGCYGRYLLYEGRYQQSTEYLEKALAAEPGDPWTLRTLGDAYRCLGEWEQSRQRYLEALRQESDEIEAGRIYNGLALVATQQGNWSEAVRCWQEAVKRLAGDAEVWYNLGDALLHMGIYHEAIKALRRNLRVGSTQPAWTCYDMAMCYYRLGDIPWAKCFCGQALRHAPDDEDAQKMKKVLEESHV
jgi:tetratricopeptide (TPR) repeat protein